jgi:hypothetical protein
VDPKQITAIVTEHVRLAHLEPPDWTATLATMTGDCFKEHSSIGLRCEGPTAVRNYYADFFGAFPTLGMEPRNRAFGPNTMVNWGILRLTMEQRWMGMAATRRTAALPCVTVIELRDAFVVGETMYYDSISFCDQLGLVHAEVLAAAKASSVTRLGGANKRP